MCVFNDWGVLWYFYFIIPERPHKPHWTRAKQRASPSAKLKISSPEEQIPAVLIFTCGGIWIWNQRSAVETLGRNPLGAGIQISSLCWEYRRPSLTRLSVVIRSSFYLEMVVCKQDFWSEVDINRRRPRPRSHADAALISFVRMATFSRPGFTSILIVKRKQALCIFILLSNTAHTVMLVSLWRSTWHKQWKKTFM